MKYVIKGLRPPTALYPYPKWGVVDRLNGTDDPQRIDKVAREKLQAWQQHSNDKDGYFCNWSFRLVEI